MSARRLACALALPACLAFAAFPTGAFAQAPVWNVMSTAAPSNLPPGGKGRIEIHLTNLGDAASAGAIVVKDDLPKGLTATGIALAAGLQTEEASRGEGASECTLATLVCEYRGAIVPYGRVKIMIEVNVAQDAVSGAVNNVRVTGGAGPAVSVASPVRVGASPRFGVESYSIVPENEDGTPTTQAGSHPFQLTTTVNLNDNAKGEPVAHVKDLHFELPPGVVGNPQVVPQCTGEQFNNFNFNLAINECPADTAVGVATLRFPPGHVAHGVITVPIFNLTPSVGEPARFGFNVIEVPVILDTSVRTGGDYGVSVSVSNISQVEPFVGSQVTFWGSPDDPRHDGSRGWFCLLNGEAPLAPFGGDGPCNIPTDRTLTPFLTLPTSCEGSLHSTVQADSWLEPNASEPGEYTLQDSLGDPLGMQRCDRLDFRPTISLIPDGQAGSTPTGLTVGLHVPQNVTLNPTGLAEADVRDTTVALPVGVALNPAAADGLMSCSLAQIELQSGNPASCPEASKVGTVQIKTPLLPDPLEGAAYLATQNANPFGSLIALYIVAEDPTSGVVVKFAGQVTPDARTGQLVSTFKNTPQLPFEDLHLKFFGGDRAPLATPPLCGTYTTTAAISSYASSEPAVSSSNFNVISGPNGGPCANPLPFAPSLTTGTTSIQAGAYSPFTLTMSHEDGDQSLEGIQLKMPPGVLGVLAHVPLCGEPQAAQGACGPESLIGHTIVSVGFGGDPFSVTGGRVYLTGPYNGAPYGLSIVNPAKAGPFDLGSVIVRASINVDPTTAALTITSYPLPTIIDGIPLHIKHVNVSIDRPEFTFNPTNCDRMSITGTLSSAEGASSALSVPFQVTNCATLGFKPRFQVSTSGRTSRARGASLDARVTYPSGSFGAQANIAKVKVELPKQLPSRLSTLQKACTSTTFNANPAACPPASVVGIARATTPILPVPLSGSVYFVSHGGEAFPSLIIVLQGYGVRVNLVGSTFISRAGITSTTFSQVPDVPIDSFELYLPQGSSSALAANGNICKSKLAMPTEFVAQNGVKINESTRIAVTGCPKAKAAKRSKAKQAARRAHRARASGRSRRLHGDRGARNTVQGRSR